MNNYPSFASASLEAATTTAYGVLYQAGDNVGIAWWDRGNRRWAILKNWNRCYVSTCQQSPTHLYHMIVPVAAGHTGKIMACSEHIKTFEIEQYRGKITCTNWLEHGYGACRCFRK